MALNIKDEATVALAAEVAVLAGETKTRAVKVALEERRDRLRSRRPELQPGALLRRLLEDEIWPQVPAQNSLSRAEREAILGYGEAGI